jgi:hypothetical protein
MDYREELKKATEDLLREANRLPDNEDSDSRIADAIFKIGQAYMLLRTK